MRGRHRLAVGLLVTVLVPVLGCSDDRDGTGTNPSPIGEPPPSAAGAAGQAGAEAQAGAGGSTTSAAGAPGAAGRSGAAGGGGAGSTAAGAGGGAGEAGSSAGSGGMSAAAGMAGSANPDPSGGAGAMGGAGIELFKATGLTKYIGAAKPSSMQEGANGETQFTFAIEAGPRCLRGDPYSMSIRKRDSDSLLIYLQGGGSCSSAVCSATATANPRIPASGINSASDRANPVASWNVVYVPYCDGSLHYGDKDHESESPPRYHRGLRNLSAALDAGVANFPNPKRILLAGSSAGGLGTIWASMIVRVLYPEAELFVFNDAGIGISTPDGSRAMITRNEWGTEQFIPASCPDCKSSPHTVPVISWNLAHDPGLRVAFFSAYEDTVLANTFLMIGGPAFKRTLLEETDKVAMAHPERAKRFFINGTKHTTLGDIHATTLSGVDIGEWTAFMLSGDPEWKDMLQ